MQGVVAARVAGPDVGHERVRWKALRVLVQSTAFVVRQTGRIIVGDEQPSHHLPPDRVDVAFGLAFPAKTFLQSRDDFFGIRRPARPDRLTFFKNDRPDEQLAFSVQAGQVQQPPPELDIAVSLRRLIEQHARTSVGLDRNSPRHETQDHVDVVALPDEELEFVLIQRPQHALGELLSRDRHDGDRRVLGDAGGVFKRDRPLDGICCASDASRDPRTRPKVECGRYARYRCEMHRSVVAGSRDIQEQQIGLDITDRPVVLDHRPMHGDGRETAGQKQ